MSKSKVTYKRAHTWVVRVVCLPHSVVARGRLVTWWPRALRTSAQSTRQKPHSLLPFSLGNTTVLLPPHSSG